MGREARINQKLTRKQTMFVKQLADGKSATQAAMVAYNVSNPKTASVIASQNLNKLSIREALEEALSSNGLSLSIITSNLGSLANSKPEKVSGDTVLKANVELLKLHGAYPDRKSFQVSYSFRDRIKSMSSQEVEAEIEKIESETKEILDEEIPTTTPFVLKNYQSR